ncbi:MAG: hypothetical protein ABIG99_00855 [Patescibacteria group bacterium]
MRKEPNDQKLFNLIPKTISGFFAVLLIIVCLIYLKMIVGGFLSVLF